MKISKTLTCFLFVLYMLGGISLQAQQKLSFDKVYSVYLRNSGPIMESEEIKGYFLFYQSDKVDKNTNEYSLQILDENLNKVKEVKFTDDKSVQLMESSFNGNSLVFAFYSKDEMTITYRIYGLDGKKKYEYAKTLDKKSRNYLEELNKNKSEEGQNKTVFDIDNRGFISVTPLREGKEYTYEIDMMMSDRKKQITFTPTDEIKYQSAQYLGANDSVAVFEVMKKAKMMSNKFQSWLLGISLITGKKVFEVSTETQRYKFLPMNVSTLNGSSDFMLLGSYYDQDDRVVADKTLGLAVWTMDNTGKILAQKYNSWSSEIGKFLNTDAKGRVEDIGYLYFHKIIQTEDGKIFAIGEGYKKTASAGGIALTALGVLGGRGQVANVTKMTVTDLVMIEFNAGFDVKNATIYEKNKNNVGMPYGGDYVSPHLLALLVKAFGGFDYAFTQTDKKHTNFIVGYTDYEKSKEFKGLTFHSISYYSGNFTTDKINMTSKATKTLILPGKTGSVMIIEYFKKEKRIDLRLEKLN